MNTKLNTALLAIIAIGVAAGPLLSLIPVAEADGPEVACHVYDVELDYGRRRGAGNVQGHATEIQALLQETRSNGMPRTVYSNSFPVRSGMSGDVLAEKGVICFAAP